MVHRSASASHILSFAQTLQGGGVERALLRLARGWHAAGRRVTLVIGSTQGPLAEEIPAGVEVRELGRSDYRSLLLDLPSHVEALNPDLIFTPGNHYTSAAAYIRMTFRGATPPTIGKVSNALVRPDFGPVMAWGYRRWLRLHRRFLDQVVAMTPAMGEEAEREMGLAPDRISVIANPLAWSLPGAHAVPLPAGRFLLGVGRLEAQKRWDRLIDAMPRLRDPAVQLVILGEGSLRGELEARIAALGLQDRVHLPGHSTDPLHAVRRAEAVVLTSDYEGVPGVLREALAVGTPAISTESSVAVREIIASPELGSVVPREGQEALVAAIDRWLSPLAVRPRPCPIASGDSVTAYLALFDRVAARVSAARSAGRSRTYGDWTAQPRPAR